MAVRQTNNLIHAVHWGFQPEAGIINSFRPRMDNLRVRVMVIIPRGCRERIWLALARKMS